MEIKLGVFREFLEEQLKESIDVLSCSVGVASTVATIGVTNIQGLFQPKLVNNAEGQINMRIFNYLIQEYNVGVAVP